jgi:hypothetical protein
MILELAICFIVSSIFHFSNQLYSLIVFSDNFVYKLDIEINDYHLIVPTCLNKYREKYVNMIIIRSVLIFYYFVLNTLNCLLHLVLHSEIKGNKFYSSRQINVLLTIKQDINFQFQQ